MGKRKAEEAGLPAQIDQHPCSASGTGPFTVYFPSGFNPNGEDAACEWAAYEHSKGKNHFSLVARTVRDRSAASIAPGGAGGAAVGMHTHA